MIRTQTSTHTLRGYQRAALLRQAHQLSATAAVGRSGASDAVLQHVQDELEHHELIKVKFTDHKDDRRGIAEDVAHRTGAVLVGIIGHVAILYRAAGDPRHRRIVFPER